MKQAIYHYDLLLLKAITSAIIIRLRWQFNTPANQLNII